MSSQGNDIGKAVNEAPDALNNQWTDALDEEWTDALDEAVNALNAADNQLADVSRVLSETISVHETRADKHQQKLDKLNRKIEALEGKIEAHEREIEALERTGEEIERKMGGNITEATSEKLEELLDKVNDKIDTVRDKIDDIQDQIEHVHDEIEELEEEYSNTVDEDLIREVSSLPGLNGFVFSAPGSETIDIEVFREFQQKAAGFSNEEREKRRAYKQQNRSGTNLCADARIDSFCCAHYDGHENFHPENMIDDDPDLKTLWFGNKSHYIVVSAEPHFAVIDLGEEQSFNYVQIKKASVGSIDKGRVHLDMSAWRIEVSNDNATWTEFNKETNDGTAVYEKAFDTQRGRYVRLLIDAAEADPGNRDAHVRVCEFNLKMLSKNGDKDVTKDANVISCSHHTGNEYARNILSPSPNRKWHSNSNRVTREAMPHWAIIDFGAERTFNRLRMVKASLGAGDKGKRKFDMSAWRFEVSSDKENWTEFIREINDTSDVYVKSFPEQTGRYVRLWVDAGENNPNNKHAHVRIYDLRIEMCEPDDGVVTLDDIIAIAPFAKKETIEKLMDKLSKVDSLNFVKLSQVIPFMGKDAVDRFFAEAFERDDFNTVMALVPFASKPAIERMALTLDTETEFDKLQSLIPFLGKEAIAGILIGGGRLNMQTIRTLAPLLGSELIDELLQEVLK